MKFSIQTQNKKNYWFRPKTYGFGFYPVTWQGWLASLVFVAILLLSAYSHGLLIHGFQTMPAVSLQTVARYMVDTFIITTLFHVLFQHKVDGGVKWRWGAKK